MRSLLSYFAILIGKILIILSRKLRLGGGSNFPGRIALKLAPWLPAHLAARFPRGTVLVTATNGKTTTTRMIAAGCKQAGISLVYNITGANMRPGITTALIEATSLRGRIAAELGLFEVDEGSIPVLAPLLKPRVVLVGNFFRDQLDRYGEVATLAARVGEALRALDPAPLLVLNGDDPIVAALGRQWQGDVCYFGLDDAGHGLSGVQGEADIRYCLFCREFLDYRTIYLGHLGDFHCPGCGFARPDLDMAATAIHSNGLDGQGFRLRLGEEEHDFSLPVPGEHVLYNLLGALSVLVRLGVPPAQVRDCFAAFLPPYGRFERLDLDGRAIYLILIKNPAGANVILRLLARVVRGGHYLALLNDLSADGRDVSWIYDAEFELLADLERVTAGGRRAEDMALRLAYAGVPGDRIALGKDVESALEMALTASSPTSGPLYILATYTAMHQVRRALAQRTEVSKFWKEQ